MHPLTEFVMQNDDNPDTGTEMSFGQIKRILRLHYSVSKYVCTSALTMSII